MRACLIQRFHSASTKAKPLTNYMKILYDGQVYRIQSFGGVSRYFDNIIGRLPPDFTPYVIAPDTPKRNFPTQANLRILNYGTSRLEHISWRLNRLVNTLQKEYIERVSMSKRFDVAHPTYYSLLTQRELREYRCPVVVTVHDMIHDLFPTYTTNTGAEIERKRQAVRDAQAVISISENTKKDLLDLYPIPEHKVTVVHLASGIDATLAHGNDPVPTKPYYLYVGGRTGYKNFDRLLRAFANAFGCSADMTLCVVGDNFTLSEQELIAQLNLTNRIEYYGQVSDAQLAKLYRCSVAFVYPSLYEGFGIPLLEAMACGTAVIASKCSSIPEVVGDAAVLFDPASIDEMTAALLFLADNQTYRQCLIAKGQKRARMFSWDKTLAKTLEVYRSLQN